MKSKNYILILAVITAAFLSSCNPRPATPLTISTGTSLQDTLLPKLLFKLVHEGSNYYFAYYGVNSMVVDTTTSPPTLTMTAQSAAYSATNTSSVIHNGTTTSQVSSTQSVNTDTVTAVCAGPFNMSTGYIYSSKGYLHYTSKATGDTCICTVTDIVYFNQSGAGQSLLIGYVTQVDLHATKPSSSK